MLFFPLFFQMDKVIINNPYLYKSGYVRTHVMRGYQGFSNLTEIHIKTMDAANGTNNFSSIAEVCEELVTVQVTRSKELRMMCSMP